MGRYSSGSEEEKKKRKKKKKKRSRSRSRSESIESRHSTKAKKSKKKKKRKSRSRSRSADRYRRSRSRSYGRRSRSRSRDRYRKRSQSVSRGRYSRSRSRDRRRRRSRSYDSYSRSSRRSRSYTPGRKSKKNRSSAEREDPCANIPGFAELTPSEQSKIRMHMALKAAAAADEKLKGDVPKSTISVHDSMAYSQAIQDIESSSFAASSFKSSRGERKEEKASADDFTFGTAGELRLDSQRKPVLVDVDNEELAHPSLYTNPEEKLTRWIQKLAAMRRKKLEGEALT